MKVALVNGPTSDGSLFVREGRCTQRSSIWSTQWPPVSLAYLAAIARQDGHKAMIYDCPAQEIILSDLVNQLTTTAPELILLSVSTPSFRYDMKVAKVVKEALPETSIGLFGVHATALDKEILEVNSFVDFIIRNEPERSFGELLKTQSEGLDLSDLPGMTFLQKNEIKRNPDRPFIDDLDSLPFPAWDLVNSDNYLLPFSGKRFLCLTPSRGCPYRCTFCTGHQYYGRKLRLRSVESIVREVVHDRNKYGVDDFFIWTETFTLKRDFVNALCLAIMTECPGISWTCNSRTDTVDPELLGQMARAGCWMISFGIESSDRNVLDRARKKMDIEKVHKAVRAAKNAGIITLGHFIFGLPGETRETIKRTSAFARFLPLDFVQFYTAAPFAGSELYDQGLKEGWLSAGQYDFIAQDRATLALPGLSRETVDKARLRATIAFYANPRRILFLIRFAGFGLVRMGVKILLKRILKR